MITLLDFLQDMSYGEFQHLSIGQFDPTSHDSEPDARSYAQFLSHLNKGLSALHGRFPLRFEEVDIQLHEEITDYFLDYEYASSNLTSSKPVLYIMDTVSEPFADNVLKIEEVFDEEGDLLHMNDVDEDLSVFTPRNNLVQVPWPNDWNMISVQYRADHPKLVYSAGLDPSAVELQIPRHMTEALQFYVAARMTNSLPQEGATFWSKYRAAVEMLNMDGTYPQAEVGNSKLDDRGFA